MGKINFKRGEFITHLTMPGSFAIYGGEELPPIEGDETNYKDYTLICYYNASTQKNNPEAQPIFEADINEQMCQYVLSEKDAFWWRRCNSDEKFNALKILAEKYNLAWEEKSNKLRVLGTNEKLVLDDNSKPTTQRNKETRQRTENVIGRVPLLPSTVSHTQQTSVKKQIVLRYPSQTYKQVKKITSMSLEMNQKLVETIESMIKTPARTPYCGNHFNYPHYGPYHDMYDEFWGD